jgi:tetratricopeptide (TPR) repeat protein
MKRRLLGIGAMVVAVAALAGYLALRRDAQYQTLLAAGDEAVVVGDATAAIEAFSGAIALRSESMLGWLRRGEVYLRRGDHRLALRDLRRAVTLDPAALPPLELIGDTLMGLERYGRAADHYEAYLRLDDRDARVLYKLGLAWLYAGRPDLAVAALDRALRLADDDAPTHYLRGLCLAEIERPADAIRALEQAVSLAPALVDARKALARLYRRDGRTADEVRQLEAVAAIGPPQDRSHIAVADAWTRAGRFDRAVATLAWAIEHDPDDPQLLVALAQVWLTAAEGRNDDVSVRKAVTLLQQAQAFGSTAAALALLGRAQLMSDDAAGAVQTLSQATSMLPVDSRAFGDLAAAAERLQQWGPARDALLRQIALDGDQVTAAVRIDRARRLERLETLLGASRAPQPEPPAASPVSAAGGISHRAVAR